MDAAILGVVGKWVGYFEEAIRAPRPVQIVITNKEDDFLLRDGHIYYLFCFNLPMKADGHVSPAEEADYLDCFKLSERIKSVRWMDSGEEAAFSQEGGSVTVHTAPYCCGRNLVVRVAKIVC